jgi:hypothetical protein
MNISRRNIVGGLAATPIATLASATTGDAELVTLGEQFTATVNLLFDGESEWWNDKALLSRLGEIGTAIMDTPATTMGGLGVKARIACFVQGSGIWFSIDPTVQQPGFPFAMSIVADLVRRYDPDLEWVDDLVPSPERARLARANRQNSERLEPGE